MKHWVRAAAAAAVLVLAGSGMAEAHTFGAYGAGFFTGLLHPAGGLDHVLAMVAVGLWASQIGGRALWAIPGSFVAMMAAGGVWGMLGAPLPWAEGGVLASVLVLGAAVALAWRSPLRAGMAVAGVFAVFHGYVHGAEIPQSASPALYAVGFVLATAILHASGVGWGAGMRRMGGIAAPLVRIGGGLIAASAPLIWLSQ